MVAGDIARDVCDVASDVCDVAGCRMPSPATSPGHGDVAHVATRPCYADGLALRPAYGRALRPALLKNYLASCFELSFIFELSLIVELSFFLSYFKLKILQQVDCMP